MNTNGYVKVHRTLLEHTIWTCERFTRGQAWVDLILMANYEESDHVYRGGFQTINRGEIATSMEFLAKRWGWTRKVVKTFLKGLSKVHMISYKTSRMGTTITIENYASFQDWGTTEGTSKGTTPSTLRGTLCDPQHKNIKNKEKRKGGVVRDTRVGY